jgi:hypothetical protein
MPEMEFVTSGNIEAIGYDDDNRELYVRFLKSGQTYVYSEFDRYIFDEFRMADSKGTFFNSRVLNMFPTRKL